MSNLCNVSHGNDVCNVLFLKCEIHGSRGLGVGGVGGSQIDLMNRNYVHILKDHIKHVLKGHHIDTYLQPCMGYETQVNVKARGPLVSFGRLGLNLQIIL